MPTKDKEKQAAYCKKHYMANKDKIKARSKAWNIRQRALIRKIINEIKETTPCADCGDIFPPFVMDFDHCSGDKVMNISQAAAKHCSVSTLRAEIKKCELVCSNCHRIRTFERSLT